MKKLLVSLTVGVLLLTGCGSSKEKTAVCQVEIAGMTAMNEFKAEGNKVVYQEQVLSMDAEATISSLIAQGVIEDESELEDYFQTFIDQYTSIDGVEHSYEKKGDVIEQVTIIDFKKADINKLQENALIESSGNVSMIGLKETVEGLESQGFSCTIKE